MTNEELDEARAKEAVRLFDYVEDGYSLVGHGRVAIANIAARLARENWTPPKPVDPDVLAFREWVATSPYRTPGTLCQAYLAGARMARERAKPLAQYLQDRADRDDAEADHILAKYDGEA